MLPKSRRLTRCELLRLRASRPSPTAIGLLYLFPGSGKAAIVVSTKLSKRAVDRNALRRRFYTAIQQIEFSSQDLLLYPSPKSVFLSVSELTAHLKTLLK